MFALLLAAPSALAATPECDPKDPELCAVDLVKGQPAPYTGQLLTIQLAIKLGQKADRYDQVLPLEVEYARKLASIDYELEKKLHAEDNATHLREMQAMQEALKAAAPPFYEKPWFVSAMTGVLAVGAFSLAVWSAGQL